MNSHEIWQVEAQGIVYDASIEEIIEWINEGSVLPEDKVRKGNLRWLKANKVPELYTHFNGNQFENNSSVTTTLTEAVRREEIAGSDSKDIELMKSFWSETTEKPPPKIESSNNQTVSQNTNQEAVNSSAKSTDCCSVHPDKKAQFICGTCLTLYCKTCPSSFGGNVKICLDCGAMCRVYTGVVDFKSVGAMNKPYPRGELDQNKSDGNKFGNFGLGDFAGAIIYPFKFKTSLIFGAVLFMFFMLGQSVSAFGITMYFAAGICLMMANTLVFGSLANTLENFSQGKTNLNFMPSFDEFNLWDDVIHPFLLSFGVYFVSFGFFLLLLFGALWQTSDSENKIEEEKQKIVSTVLPRVQNILKSGEQTSQSNQSSEQLNASDKERKENSTAENDIAQLQQNAKEAANFQKLHKELQQTLQAQTQAENSINVENEKGLFDHTLGTVLRLSLIFSVPIFIAFLWGIFYFPAACAVAGYTGSFTAAVNPLIAFDTIKRLGFDYFKVVVIFTFFIALTVGLSAILQFVFSSVNLPMLGNLPAKAVISVFAFYLSIVFSVVLGILLAKNSARLNLRHN
jgi:hypothetical protein